MLQNIYRKKNRDWIYSVCLCIYVADILGGVPRVSCCLLTVRITQ